jgi:hypothetical protein
MVATTVERRPIVDVLTVIPVVKRGVVVTIATFVMPRLIGMVLRAMLPVILTIIIVNTVATTAVIPLIVNVREDTLLDKRGAVATIVIPVPQPRIATALQVMPLAIPIITIVNMVAIKVALLLIANVTMRLVLMSQQARNFVPIANVGGVEPRITAMLAILLSVGQVPITTI